ncbi:MAG TPA: hypothetical protein VG651_17690 [Stellaceae bacterium]|nr:hypothetical protein [Stellaceae bacterium]
MNVKPVETARRQDPFKSAFSKVAAAGRRLRQRSGKPQRTAWLRELVHRAPPPLAAPAHPPQPDPVKLAVLAMDSLGRASMRASFTGVEVKVAVPDHATAAIFRAALSETVRNRPTDRLVRVVVD